MAHPDGVREVRAMVLAGIPVPPMPAMGCRRLEDEHGTVEDKPSAFCSFNLIAHMLNVSAKHRNEAANLRRMELQKRADEALFAGIDEFEALPTDVERVWPIFCEYKRAYVASFALRDVVDLRFEHPLTVARGSETLNCTLDHAKGHDNLFGPLAGAVGGAVDDTMSYKDLVIRAAQRIWLSGAQGAVQAVGEAGPPVPADGDGDCPRGLQMTDITSKSPGPEAGPSPSAA